MHKVKIQKAYFPLIISLSVVIIITALVFFLSFQNTDGIFVYSLDDAYIHLAYAKNIFLHNVWGITSHGFTSTTSSPLWTLLITAVFFLTGLVGGMVAGLSGLLGSWSVTLFQQK